MKLKGRAGTTPPSLLAPARAGCRRPSQSTRPARSRRPIVYIRDFLLASALHLPRQAGAAGRGNPSQRQPTTARGHGAWNPAHSEALLQGGLSSRAVPKRGPRWRDDSRTQAAADTLHRRVSRRTATKPLVLGFVTTPADVAETAP